MLIVNIHIANDWTVAYRRQTQPIVREGAPKRQDNKFQTQSLEKEAISGQTQSGLDAKTY
jgi:hypothetical protein